MGEEKCFPEELRPEDSGKYPSKEEKKKQPEKRE